VLARQVEAAMKRETLSKAEMARRMHTSRAALDRLLDPDYDAVTLSTLRKAARPSVVACFWRFPCKTSRKNL
jgi:antitoxin HicB